MPVAEDNLRSIRQLRALQTGSALWRSFLNVRSHSACSVISDLLDPDACRAIVALDEAIKAGGGTPPEDAQAAVDLILCSYQRAQFQDVVAFGTLLGAALMKRAPGLVAMAVDDEHGIATKCVRYPPNLATVSTYLSETSERVRLIAWGARKGLGMVRTTYAGVRS